MLPAELFMTLIIGVIAAVALNGKSKQPQKPPSLEQRVDNLEKRMKKDGAPHKP